MAVTNFLWCLDVYVRNHVPLVRGPCQRPSRWLSFLQGPVEQTVLKGSPTVRPQAAPPAGWLQCWQVHLSLPESSALMGKQQHRWRKKLNTAAVHIAINVTKINKPVITNQAEV